MGVTGQNIVLLLLTGLILGLLSSTIADRKGLRLVADIGAAVVVMFAIAWLVVAWRDLIATSLKPLPEKSVQETSLEAGAKLRTGRASTGAVASASQTDSLSV